MKSGGDGNREGRIAGALRGIVVMRGGAREAKERPPRIAAFIWGGKVRPTPTLPYGRWKRAS